MFIFYRSLVKYIYFKYPKCGEDFDEIRSVSPLHISKLKAFHTKDLKPFQ